MQSLQDKLDKDDTKLNSCSSKRKLELEGFQSDLSNLEKRMIFY